MAARFNHVHAQHFVLPAAAIDQSVAILPVLGAVATAKAVLAVTAGPRPVE